MYCPGKMELEDVLRITDDKGWLEAMRDDVSRVQGNAAVLSEPSARAIANIRFRSEDVKFFDPMPRVIGSHKISNIPRRYHPYDWVDDSFPNTTNQPPTRGETILGAEKTKEPEQHRKGVLFILDMFVFRTSCMGIYVKNMEKGTFIMNETL